MVLAAETTSEGGTRLGVAVGVSFLAAACSSGAAAAEAAGPEAAAAAAGVGAIPAGGYRPWAPSVNP